MTGQETPRRQSWLHRIELGRMRVDVVIPPLKLHSKPREIFGAECRAKASDPGSGDEPDQRS
jgi:hypothetical protein